MRISKAIGNSISPQKTVKSVVENLRIEEVRNNNGFVSQTYYAFFVTETGDHFRMIVPKRVYYSLAIGDVGILVRKGGRFISFHSLSINGEQQISG